MTLEQPDTQGTEDTTPQTPSELPPPPFVPVGPAIVEEDDPATADERGDDSSDDEPTPS